MKSTAIKLFTAGLIWEIGVGCNEGCRTNPCLAMFRVKIRRSRVESKLSASP
jgi:hypothetical protein